MAEKEELLVGDVTHYFDHIKVAVIKLKPKATLKKGDEIHFKGANDDFTQKITSLQVDHKDIDEVKAGMDFGLQVSKKVHVNTEVYKTN